MKYQFVYYNSTQNKKLSDIDKVWVAKYFPNANLVNFAKLGPATANMRFEQLEGEMPPAICQRYGCDMQKKYSLKLEIDDKEMLVSVPELICKDIRFTCYVYEEFRLSYNCIGWALGIRDWIDPKLLNKKPVTESALTTFISEVSSLYPIGDHRLTLDIITDLKTTKSSCLTRIDGKEGDKDVAFYFKKNMLTHAARFVNEIEKEAVNSWTSKLGEEILVSHRIDDLNDHSLNSTYGIATCFSYANYNLHNEL